MQIDDFELSCCTEDKQLFVAVHQTWDYDAHTWLSRDDARKLAEALLRFADTGSLE